jgi:hypothetical protein
MSLGWELDAIGTRVMHLAHRLRTQLAAIPGVTLCDLGIAPCGIVTFTHAQWSPVQIEARLASQRINVTTSSQFSTRYDMEARNLAMVVRASVHYYNDDPKSRVLWRRWCSSAVADYHNIFGVVEAAQAWHEPSDAGHHPHTQQPTDRDCNTRAQTILAATQLQIHLVVGRRTQKSC